jgi:cardiolipin synthase A/B
MLIELNDAQLFLSTIYLIYVVGMTGVLLLDNKPPQSTVAWLLTIYFLPFVGLLLYVFAGVNWKKHKILQQRPEERFQQQLKDVIQQQQQFLRKFNQREENMGRGWNSDIRKSIQLLLNSNSSTLTLNNRYQLFHQGAKFFDSLRQDLQNAQVFIHMEFFIWKSDALGWEFAELLCEKAQSGVEVRLLFDGVGCFGRMSRAYKRKLKNAGVEFLIFLDPLNVFISGLANYLNHRKIVVIDGQISYIGGMNMAEEYITGGKSFPSWRDTGLRLEGEMTQQLHTVFVTDWFNSSQQWLSDKKYFPAVTLPTHSSPPLPMQLACSGPDSNWFSIKQLFFNLIINADREVYIQSPYFIPDDGFATAMETAALSGVSVHLMMTGLPDKRVPYWAAETYFERILRSGGRIYRYKRGFLHCKTICVDESIASVGTCNLDVRSFELDYEVNAVVYDTGFAKAIKTQFYLDLAHCQEITLADIAQYSLWHKLRNALLRILSPLL